ncbi:MAG TPA: sigma-70 family RNA polymerase sigma factor [Bacteroidales bacterium]|nr:sigma-70 family RNA polymerase sigma factor [Bacteroidales bacterium]
MTNDFWEKTYERYSPRLLGVCYRYIPNRIEAEDLMHEAFLTAMNRFDTFTGKGSFEGWLRRITVNTALMHLRKKQPVVYAAGMDFPDDKETIYEEKEWEDVIQSEYFSIEELQDCINSLPSPYKEVFNLYVIDNFTHKEIGKILDIRTGTSKSYLARARKKIQKNLMAIAQKKNIPWLLQIKCREIPQPQRETGEDAWKMERFKPDIQWHDPIFRLFDKKLSYFSLNPIFHKRLNQAS